jgi:[ribosomal protein S5]-alanine N-acetyltransferase
MSTRLTVPIIETKRLILRAPRMEDSEDIFAAYAQDTEVTRYLVWAPHNSVNETREFLQRVLESKEMAGDYNWAITLKGDDKLRGMIGLRVRNFKADAGYVLARELWGKGYMTEALRAVVDFAFTLPGMYRVWALCDVENIGSARVMEKAGMEFEGILRRYTIHQNAGSEPRDVKCYAKTI